jgi:hypothetical protein
MRSARVAAFAIALAGAACLVAPRAAAEPTAEERNAARSMLLEGIRHMEGRDPKRALELFRAADSVMNVPTTRWAIATALDKLGRFVEEEAVLTELLKQPGKLDDPPAFLKARTDARAKLAEVTRRIAELHIEGPPGQIAIDGVAASGASTRVNPGKHVVALTPAAGKGEVKEAIVIVADGEKRTVHFDGAAVGPSAPSAPAGAPVGAGCAGGCARDVRR